MLKMCWKSPHFFFQDLQCDTKEYYTKDFNIFCKYKNCKIKIDVKEKYLFIVSQIISQLFYENKIKFISNIKSCIYFISYENFKYVTTTEQRCIVRTPCNVVCCCPSSLIINNIYYVPRYYDSFYLKYCYKHLIVNAFNQKRHELAFNIIYSFYLKYNKTNDIIYIVRMFM